MGGLSRSSLKWVTWGVFRSSGYEWGVHRSGDLSLGFWKKSLRSGRSKKAYPKRIVLIPGFGDSPVSWHFSLVLLTPLLRRKYDELIVLDFPAYPGALAAQRGFPTFNMMNQVVGDSLDHFKPHTLVGHSLGGYISAHYSAQCGLGQRPKTNSKNYSGPETLILINPSGIYSSPEVHQQLMNLFLGEAGLPVLRPHLFGKEPLWFPLVLSHYRDFLGREDIHHFLRSIHENHSLVTQAAQIQARVWILWGENDTLIPASCGQAWLCALSPGVNERHQAVLLKGVGHAPHLERPTVLSLILGQILSEKMPHRLGRYWWNVLERDAIERASVTIGQSEVL